LSACAERVRARVHGACVGAGIELPAFAAHVSASADASFRLPEVSMGLVPGAGGTASLTRRIGRQRTAWMALSGEAVDAGTALAWGLVDEIVQP
jgi:enoyl-CoA hydratase/carnithine racemase